MIVTRIYSGQLERWTAYGAITLRNTGQSGIYGVASDPDGASVVALGASPDVAWVRWDRAASGGTRSRAIGSRAACGPARGRC
jgi:hypothetical protein